MAMGRPRKADAIKAQKGTLQKCRTKTGTLAASAVKLDIAPPGPPPGLNGDYAIQHWNDQVIYLGSMGILAKTDMGALAMLCQEWQNYMDSEAELVGRPRFYSVRDETGEIKYMAIHPAHTISQQHLKSYISLCNEFGFTPAARSRISLPIKENIKSRAAGLLKKAV